VWFSTFVEVEGEPNLLGPMALMGSTAFNLLLVTGISIMMASDVKRLLAPT
jgi:hypothetical protein